MNRTYVHRFLLLAFFAWSNISPAAVLCIAPDGTATVEFVTSPSCCAANDGPWDPGMQAGLADDCSGCFDVDMSLHAVFGKRLAPSGNDGRLITSSCYSASMSAGEAAEHLPRRPFIPPPAHQLLDLSTIVIRC